MKKVTFEFVGQDAEEMAQKFYTWFVDGGLEDQVVDTLSDMGPSEVEVVEIDNEKLNIILNCKYKGQDKEQEKRGCLERENLVLSGQPLVKSYFIYKRAVKKNIMILQ